MVSAGDCLAESGIRVERKKYPVKWYMVNLRQRALKNSFMPNECTRSDYANLSPTETENFRDLFRAADSINGPVFGKSRIGWCHRDARNIVTLQRSSAILRVRIDDAVMETFSRASSGRENSVVEELLAIVERERVESAPPCSIANMKHSPTGM